MTVGKHGGSVDNPTASCDVASFRQGNVHGRHGGSSCRIDVLLGLEQGKLFGENVSTKVLTLVDWGHSDDDDGADETRRMACRLVVRPRSCTYK